MPDSPKRVTHKSGKAMRDQHIDVRMTRMQKDAIIRAAQRKTLDASSWMRSIAIELTDWNPEDDIEWKAQQDKKRKGGGGTDTPAA